jgi:hypothetical protein
MNAGEIWTYNDGLHAVLIKNRPQSQPCPDNGIVWEVEHLLTGADHQYHRTRGGRVSSVVDPSAYYTGEGTIFENEYFYGMAHLDKEGIIVEIPTTQYTIIPELTDGGNIV